MLENTLVFIEAGTALSGWLDSSMKYIPTIFGAFLMGVIGSVGYYAALRLGFIGPRLHRRFFLDNIDGAAGVLSYAVIGGSIAVVFQLAGIESFVPVQSFVLGVSWPMIVSQYVTREARIQEEEAAEITGALRRQLQALLRARRRYGGLP